MLLLNILIWTWFVISAVLVAAVALGDNDEERGQQLFVALFWPILLGIVVIVLFLEALTSLLSTRSNPAPPKDTDPV